VERREDLVVAMRPPERRGEQPRGLEVAGIGGEGLLAGRDRRRPIRRASAARATRKAA